MSATLDKKPVAAPSSLRREVVSSETLAVHRQVADKPAKPTRELMELMANLRKSKARQNRQG